MYPRFVRRYLTSTSNIPGTWRLSSPNQIIVSSLGTGRFEEGEGGRICFNLPKLGDILVSLGAEDRLDESMPYIRSLLFHLPRQDSWYRRFAATDVYEAHKLIGSKPTLSIRELSRQLHSPWIQVWYPLSTPSSATIWYAAGDLLDGARVGVQLDERRRYCEGGIG